MSDNNRFEDEQVNYSDLIFDWGNPSAPVKKTVRKTVPQKQKEEPAKEERKTEVPKTEPESVSYTPPYDTDSGHKTEAGTGKGRSAGAAAAARLMGKKAGAQERPARPQKKTVRKDSSAAVLRKK